MTPQDFVGREIAGYRLLERIGEGGTATVYRAEHASHGRCAFKTLRDRLKADPTDVKRFLREAEYGARVRHPGVVRTYDHGNVDGIHYLALEWVDGKPLASAVSEHHALAADEVARIVDQIASALAATHAVGIIHRDLKPENIIYDAATHTVKLLDFGIARDAQQGSDERLTRAGFFVGSLQYVSPEALSGELVGEAADIYSLATIAYYLLTGIHPYSGRTQRELFQQLLNEEPTPLNQAGGKTHQFPDALEKALVRGLQRNPANRQPDVTAFAAEFRKAVGQVAPAAGPDPKPGLLGTIKSWMGRNS